MQPVDEFTSIENYYSLGTDADTGKNYASIPVTTGHFDYDEYYEIDDDQLLYYLIYPAEALVFIEECRARKHDDLLIVKPGSNRGVPI